MQIDESVMATRDKLQQLGSVIFKRDGALPVLQKDSDEWKAWRQWLIDHRLPVKFMEKQFVWTVPTTWPPVDLDKALIEASKKSSVAERLKGN